MSQTRAMVAVEEPDRYRVAVLGACCAGKTTLSALLAEDLAVVESDDAVMEAADGTWPADLDEPGQRRCSLTVASRSVRAHSTKAPWPISIATHRGSSGAK